MPNLRLKKLREEKGITQQLLADILCCSQQSINSYENRGNQPDLETLIKMADYFDTSVDYLIGRSPVKNIVISQDKDLSSLDRDLICSIYSLPPELKQHILACIEIYLKKER